jgi:phosphoglucosamine mutase
MGVRDLFGTDGIRGEAGKPPLDSQTVLKIGQAIGAYFTEPGDLILIGRDPRESSYAIATALTAGLSSMGVRTKVMGVLPTPGLAYLTSMSEAKAGVMITASHNPFKDNGIKVFAGHGGKLPDNTEAALNELINSSLSSRGFGQPANLKLSVDKYENFLVDSAKDSVFTDMQIILDMANGATSGVATRVFKALGAQVTPMFDQPDGRNINVSCGATSTAALQEAVKASEGSVGAAFDGDGDRVMLVDEQGRQLNGDHILYILAITGHHREVVATIMSNMGLERALKQHDIKLHRVNVGDRYVLEALGESGLKLGGEQSGHIILPELTTTGDGILAAIQTLRNVRDSGRSLASWYDELVLLPQALVSIPLEDKAILNVPEIRAFIETQAAELEGEGRLNIRPSGTEPIARIMVESPDAPNRAKKIAQQLKELTATHGELS